MGRAGKGLLGPLVGYFDRRFDDVHQRLALLEQGLADVRTELAGLRAALELDAETTIELHHAVERSVRRLADELATTTGSPPAAPPPAAP